MIEQTINNAKKNANNVRSDKEILALITVCDIMKDANGNHWLLPSSASNVTVKFNDAETQLEDHYDLTEVKDQIPNIQYDDKVFKGLEKMKHIK